MAEEEKTTKHSGYVYNSRTKIGFEKMRKHGIVMPPFRIEDNVTRLLTSHYDRLIRKLSDAAKGALIIEGVTMDSLYKRNTTRGLYISDSVYSEIIHKLQSALIRAISSDKTKIAKQIRTQLNLARKKFFDDFIDDASDKVAIRVQFALDKDTVFQQRIAGLQERYLDSALDRITWEEDFLKSTFLMELTDYSLGRSADLNSLKDVMKAMSKTSMRDSRMFARQQFALMNKALTVTSLEQAGAKQVKWRTVQDGRVRDTHKALNNKVFPIDGIPEEQYDWGCRCSFTPVFED